MEGQTILFDAVAAVVLGCGGAAILLRRTAWTVGLVTAVLLGVAGLLWTLGAPLLAAIEVLVAGVTLAALRRVRGSDVPGRPIGALAIGAVLLAVLLLTFADAPWPTREPADAEALRPGVLEPLSGPLLAPLAVLAVTILVAVPCVVLVARRARS